MVEAPRTAKQGSAINGHVESTAQALTQLPKCTACCRLGAEVSADAETEVSGTGRVSIDHALCMVLSYFIDMMAYDVYSLL